MSFIHIASVFAELFNIGDVYKFRVRPLGVVANTVTVGVVGVWLIVGTRADDTLLFADINGHRVAHPLECKGFSYGNTAFFIRR